jgi:hypothetical protein
MCRSSLRSRDSPKLSSRSRYSIVIEMLCNDRKEMNLPYCSNQSMCHHGWKGGVGEARLVFRIFDDVGKASISNNPCSHIRYADAFQGLCEARMIDYKRYKYSTWQMRPGRLALVNCNCSGLFHWILRLLLNDSICQMSREEGRPLPNSWQKVEGDSL